MFAACPYPYILLEPILLSCYYFHPGNLSTLAEAENVCQQTGGKSLALETQDEHEAIKKAILGNSGNSIYHDLLDII